MQEAGSRAKKAGSQVKGKVNLMVKACIKEDQAFTQGELGKGRLKEAKMNLNTSK